MFVRRPRAIVVLGLAAVTAFGCATALEETFAPGGHDGGGDTSVAEGGLEHDADAPATDTAVPGSDTSPGDSAKIDGAGSDATGDAAIDTSGGDTAPADTAIPDTAIPDTAKPDTAKPDTFDAATGTTVSFPTSTSTAFSAFGGTSPLGTGGSSGYHYVSGDYVEQSYPVPAPVTALDLDLTMYDGTAGCAIGRSNTFAVKLNGTVVGSFSWTSTGGGASKPVSQKYTFGAVALASGSVTIRVEATSTVCSGGSTWNWNPGGTATMR